MNMQLRKRSVPFQCATWTCGRRNSFCMKRLFLCLAAAFSWAQVMAAADGNASPPRTNPVGLATAQQVLDLGLESTRRVEYPVRLRGLVTYPEPGANMIYVQDGSG